MESDEVLVPFRRCQIKTMMRVYHLWPELGKPVRVTLDSLWATQSKVSRRPKRRSHRNPPIVVEFEGRRFIQDGHHRLARLKWQGKKTAMVLLGVSRG